ncbi:MAG: hypothetical protein LBI74_08850 [Synergistaceae bacterium]|nr:hypothetical protein [Synergistaceae bacterium]
MNKPFGELSVDAINAINSASRIESKGRKRKAISDANWEEVWLENLAKYGIKAANEVGETAEALAAPPDADSAEDFPGDDAEPTVFEMGFEEMLTAIRKMADDPESLVESHLGVFTDPAPPGRMLNSQG